MHKKIHYAWLILAGCFLLMVDMGVHFCVISVFLKPMCASLGVNRTVYSIVQLISGLFGIFGAVSAGKLYNKFGMKRTMVAGIILSVVSMLGYSVAKDMVQLCLFAPGYGFGNGLVSTVPVSVLLANWFKQKRGTASSIAFAGSSVGNMLFTRLSIRLLATIDWRTVYMILAGIRALIVIPVALFIISETPALKGLSAYGSQEEEISDTPILKGIGTKEFIAKPAFYLLGFGCLCGALCIMGIQNHFQAFMSDLGMAGLTVANVLTVFYLTQIGGKLVLGLVLDKFGNRVSIAYVTLAFSLACLCLLAMFRNPLWGFGVALLLGLASAQGTIFPTYMTAEIVGRRCYPAIIGIMQIFNNLGSTFSTSVTSLIYDGTGGYSAAWIFYLLLFAAGCICYAIALRKAKLYSNM